MIHSLESAGRFVICLAADVKILEGDALRAALSLVTMSIIFDAHLRLHGGGGAAEDLVHDTETTIPSLKSAIFKDEIARRVGVVLK